MKLIISVLLAMLIVGFVFAIVQWVFIALLVLIVLRVLWAVVKMLIDENRKANVRRAEAVQTKLGSLQAAEEGDETALLDVNPTATEPSESDPPSRPTPPAP